MTSLLDTHRERFLRFAESFSGESPDDDYNIRLKIDHTMRVLDIACDLCASADLEQELEQAALLGALYHDLGRFPQYRKYRTFNDRISANHALLGVKALNRNRFLDDLPPAMRRHVYGAVRIHNMREIPENTPQELRTACNVVRDSDKLDIFPVMIMHLEDESPNKVVVMGAKPHKTEYTPALLEELQQGRIGDYRKLNWTNDFKLLIASWVFDLNFPKSYTILQSKGYIGRIFDTLPASEVFRNLRQKLTLHVEKQII